MYQRYFPAITNRHIFDKSCSPQHTYLPYELENGDHFGVPSITNRCIFPTDVELGDGRSFKDGKKRLLLSIAMHLIAYRVQSTTSLASLRLNRCRNSRRHTPS